MPDQYKIPQNIDVEDKILGPFTLKQFMYILVGGILIYALFNIYAASNFTLFLAISIPIAALTLALVFVQVNERPFMDFLFYFSQYIIDPKQKRWEKSTRVKEFRATAILSSDEQEGQRRLARLNKKGATVSQLNQMAMVLDSKGWTKESGNQELRGRVMSSVEEKSDVRKKFAEDENLDDMFKDIGEAFAGIKSEVQETELAEKLKVLLEE